MRRLTTCKSIILDGFVKTDELLKRTTTKANTVSSTLGHDSDEVTNLLWVAVAGRD